MVTTVISAVLNGIEANRIFVELDISSGFPCFLFVGLPDLIIKESKERIRAALENSNFEMPHKKITVNFVPANLKKAGSHLDLAIALAMIKSSDDAQGDTLNAQNNEIGVLGELALSGGVVKVKGAIPLILAMQDAGINRIIIPKENLDEAKLLRNLEVYPVDNIIEAYNIYFGLNPIQGVKCDGEYNMADEILDDFSDVKGQVMAKRSLEISAAGAHNVLLMGSPGCGKTMLARRMISILPKLSYEEIIELTKIYSVSNIVLKNQIITNRPFRSPHHTASAIAICGGGNVIRPGEITLANNGILFLDELLEYPRNVIESLRQPIEDGEIQISRVSGSARFPSRFMLLAAFNPCPCGYLYDDERKCSCAAGDIKRYLSKLSGPMMDRFDLQIILKRVEYSALRGNNTYSGEKSLNILKRVEMARNRQFLRFNSNKLNSNMSGDEISEYCKLDKVTESKLEEAYTSMMLTARSLKSILKVARTIADLDNSDLIVEKHILEALQYRRIDRITYGSI